MVEAVIATNRTNQETEVEILAWRQTSYSDTAARRVVGDPGRMRQILINLIGNAIKFTPQGHVFVDVDRGDSEASADGQHTHLILTVADSGIGISAEKIGGLFEVFHQVDSSATPSVECLATRRFILPPRLPITMRLKAAVLTPVGCPGLLPAIAKLGSSLLAICITTPLAGQMDWHDRSTEPRSRYDLAAAFDAARQRVVLFGGYGAEGALNDTWVPNRELLRVTRSFC